MNIDVVIPVYNCEKYIKEAILSVIGQTYSPRRIIVVNDGSTDTTDAIIKDIIANSPIEILYLEKKNGGLSSARNLGIKYSTSESLAFLDSDDLWLSTKLEEQVKVFNSSQFPKLGLVYTDYVPVDEDGKISPHINAVHPREDMKGYVFDKLFSGNLISGSGSGVLIRKECFNTVGDFDEELKAAEDWDMWLRIAEKFQFDYVDKELVKIRIHLCSMQKNYSKMLANEILFFNKWAMLADRKALSSWAKSIAVRVVKRLPKLDFYNIAKSSLSVETKKKLFPYCFGSIHLYLSLAFMYFIVRKSLDFVYLKTKWLILRARSI